MRHIVAAVDQFPQDDATLGRATELAAIHNAKLTVVHVVRELDPWTLDRTERERIQHQIILVALERIERALLQCTPDTGKIDIRVESGPAAARLIELAGELKADLFVMRAHQRNSIMERAIGSTTDRIIRAANVPVLILKRENLRAYNRVMIAIDPIEGAARMCKIVDGWFPQAELQLVHVVQLPVQFETAMLRAGERPIRIDEYRMALIGKATATLVAWVERSSCFSSRASVRISTGDPARTLIFGTRSPKIDLIALDPGGTSRVRQVLLGSVTHRILRDAACDVLICRSACDATPA